jgi:hypothetical protein
MLGNISNLYIQIINKFLMLIRGEIVLGYSLAILIENSFSVSMLSICRDFCTFEVSVIPFSIR